MGIVKIQRSSPPRAPVADIREAREDMTEYVIHITSSINALIEILRAGKINASFSQMGNIYSARVKPTVRGPWPAVCFTDQPLWALIDTVNTCGGRWSGYGIAVHKVPLFRAGGRPVWYMSPGDMGSELKEGQKHYKKGCRIHGGKIPPDLQFLCVAYQPDYSYTHNSQIDFTWEREWRYISKRNNSFSLWTPWGRKPAIVVKDDEDKEIIRKELKKLTSEGKEWADKFRGIISLETAQRRLEDGRTRHGRVETWPFVIIKKKATKKPPKPLRRTGD